MKALFSKSYLLAFIFLFLFSCNDEDITRITAIELKTELLEQLVGSEFVFEVSSDTSEEITNQSTFKVNGVDITGNTYTTFEPGDYEIQSFYEGISSNKLNIRVVNPSDYSQKVLIEDYTGTWCGFCPRVAYGIERLKEQSDKVVSVAVHLYSNNDVYNFDGANTLNSEFGVGGLPEGRINRINIWQSPEPDNLNQALDLTGFNAPLGLAIESSLSGSTIDATVRVGFSNTYTNNLGVVVFLLENGLIHDQTNYTNLYPEGVYVNPLEDFEHNDTLRAIYTHHLGDAIPSGETVADNIYSMNVQGTVPAAVENNQKLYLVAFVVNTQTKEVINVQKAKVGEDKFFD